MGSDSPVRRAALASFLGTVIEFYDFMLYATAAALVFASVFFANLDPVVATIASLGTIAAGNIARPLGGIVFGHFGDRLGRKRMLITTMTLMGTASVLVGLVPTPAVIGFWAPVLLVALRVVQGIAIGGEWAGSVLMSAEHATTRRGLWASFTNAGAPTGTLLSIVVLAVLTAVLPQDQLLSWGWRIPFLLSAVLLVMGLVVRSGVTETPVFAESAAATTATTSTARAKVPLVEVFRRSPKALALSVGVGFGAFVVQSTITAYLLTYAVTAGFPRATVLDALALSSFGAIFGIVGFSALSDRVGRRPVMLAGAVASIAWAFVVFPMVDSGSVVLLVVAVVLGQSVFQPALYGPFAALNTELFPTAHRYTGASLAYQLAGLGAGLSPVAFAAVQASTGSTTAVAVAIAVCCAIAAVCVLATAETYRTDLRTAGRATAPAAGG